MKKSLLKITDERKEGDATGPLGVFPLIDGCNYFIIDLAPGRGGQTGMYDIGAPGWNSMWASVGEEPPGPLPEGAVASLSIKAVRPDCHVTTTVKSATRGKEDILVEWETLSDPVDAGETRRVSCAILIYPATEKGMRLGHSYVNMDPAVKQAAKAEAARQAKVSENIQLLQQKAKKVPRLQ
jgi:hypothetical protein